MLVILYPPISVSIGSYLKTKLTVVTFSQDCGCVQLGAECSNGTVEYSTGIVNSSHPFVVEMH